MAWQTRYGTRVLNPLAARMAIIAECYHADTTAEYEVYGYQALEHGIQPGDTLILKPSDHPRLEGWVHTLNLTHGQSKLVRWDDICHAVKPKQREV